MKRIRLMTALAERGMTQRELARTMGVTETTVSRWISGARTPREDMQARISDLLQVTEAELFTPGQRTLRVMLDEGAMCPARAHWPDAGLDIMSPMAMQIPAGGSRVIDTGVHVEIPYGYAGFLKSRSGLNVKHGITSEGVIDAGYTGSIRVKLYNHSGDSYHVAAGDRISQLVILPVMLGPVVVVDSMTETDRGEGGFGSTGK